MTDEFAVSVMRETELMILSLRIVYTTLHLLKPIEMASLEGEKKTTGETIGFLIENARHLDLLVGIGTRLVLLKHYRHGLKKS